MAFFLAGMLIGFVVGAALVAARQSRDGYRSFDGGYHHDNDKPPVRTTIWGAGFEDTKH